MMVMSRQRDEKMLLWQANYGSLDVSSTTIIKKCDFGSFVSSCWMVVVVPSQLSVVRDDNGSTSIAHRSNNYFSHIQNA